MQDGSLELLTYRVSQLEDRVSALAQHLEADYIDKYQLQAEYLSRLENERVMEKAGAKRDRKLSRRDSVLLVIGGAAVALTSVGSFILSIVQTLAHG